MDLYLAGTYSRPYVFEQWKSIGGGKMDIYLAGGISGNLMPLWSKIANGAEYPEDYLLGLGKPGEGGQKILESFYYAKDNPTIQKLIPTLGSFLLDSGAFSFMSGRAAVDWDRYIEEYAEFINRFRIDLFFELDIDSVVGIRAVERLRRNLERLTGKQPIPVWHKSRGKDYFLGMVNDYKYVAIGGIVTQEVPRKSYEAAFPWFIREAHKAGARIHGLGYTSLEGIKKYHFDSVDSTAWLYGNRGGYLYRFNPRNGGFDKIPPPSGHKLRSQDAARWNFNEWIKFQRYAEKHL